MAERENVKIGKASKEEIAEKPLAGKSEKLAFMSALIISSGSLIIHGGAVAVTVSTENERLESLVCSLAAELGCGECKVTRNKRRSEIVMENALGMLCDCRVLNSQNGLSVYDRIADEFKEERSAPAYIRGAYLGAGSLSAGKYHLEFSFGRGSIAEDLAALLAKYGIAAKIAVRGTRAVVYVKDGEGISDCLALMGAAKAVLSLNSIMAQRQMSEHINRQQNCDLHNIDKQINTGIKQCAFLRELDFSALSNSLKETAQCRLEHPDYSYEQLGSVLGVSKSGLKNRLRRLKEIYDGQKNKDKE